MFAVTRTAAALAAWRADHGPDDSYPERLDGLVPRYLPAVPIDPWSDAPLVYERRAGGYLLASVGPNGIDDGGDCKDGSIIGGEWQSRESQTFHDDDVVRVPYPQRRPDGDEALPENSARQRLPEQRDRRTGGRPARCPPGPLARTAAIDYEFVRRSINR